MIIQVIILSSLLIRVLLSVRSAIPTMAAELLKYNEQFNLRFGN